MIRGQPASSSVWLVWHCFEHCSLPYVHVCRTMCALCLVPCALCVGGGTTSKKMARMNGCSSPGTQTKVGYSACGCCCFHCCPSNVLPRFFEGRIPVKPPLPGRLPRGCGFAPEVCPRRLRACATGGSAQGFGCPEMSADQLRDLRLAPELRSTGCALVLIAGSLAVGAGRHTHSTSSRPFMTALGGKPIVVNG